MEDRERKLQRDEKSRLRTRTQFRPWRNVSGDDHGGAEPARLRLAYRARLTGAALEGRARGRRQTNQFLRPHPDLDRLRYLPLLADLSSSNRHIHNPPRPYKKPRQPVNPNLKPTFRIARLALKLSTL